MFLFPTVRNEVAPDEQVQRMLFLHNVNFVISFAQFAHVSPLFNHTPSIKGDPSIKVGEQRQPWRSKFPISVPTAPKNPIRTQRPVSRETKYLALHPDNPLFCCMTTQLPVVKTKIFICAVLIAGDTLNQKGWTIHRPAFWLVGLLDLFLSRQPSA